MIDQLAALVQAKSHFRSENIKFGIRHHMRSGKTVLNHTQFLGYTKGPNGILQIVPEEAEIVRKVFDLYIQGNGVRKIKRHLEEHGIKTVTGKSEWNTSTIDRMLSNEKYIGEVRVHDGPTFTLKESSCLQHEYYSFPPRSRSLALISRSEPPGKGTASGTVSAPYSFSAGVHQKC